MHQNESDRHFQQQNHFLLRTTVHFDIVVSTVFIWMDKLKCLTWRIKSNDFIVHNSQIFNLKIQISKRNLHAECMFAVRMQTTAEIIIINQKYLMLQRETTEDPIRKGAGRHDSVEIGSQSKTERIEKTERMKQVS